MVYPGAWPSSHYVHTFLERFYLHSWFWLEEFVFLGCQEVGGGKCSCHLFVDKHHIYFSCLDLSPKPQEWIVAHCLPRRPTWEFLEPLSLRVARTEATLFCFPYLLILLWVLSSMQSSRGVREGTDKSSGHMAWNGLGGIIEVCMGTRITKREQSFPPGGLGNGWQR